MDRGFKDYKQQTICYNLGVVRVTLAVRDILTEGLKRTDG
jgi:hypothetical protein